MTELAEEIGRLDTEPRKRGRPKGSKNKPRIDVEEDSQVNEKEYEQTKAGIAASSLLGNTLWNISRRFTGYGALTEQEKIQLGEAIDPLLFKYLPMMDKWKEELNFLVVVVGIVSVRTLEKKEEINVEETAVEVDATVPEAEEVP